MTASSPATNLSNLLSAEGSIGSTVASTASWRITTGQQIDPPDAQITLYDTGGLANNPAYRINYPSVQVRVRGAKNDYPGAWAKANDIAEYLCGIQPQVLGGDNYDGIIMLGGVAFVGYDANQRPQFVVNFQCFVEPAADSSSLMHRDSL